MRPTRLGLGAALALALAACSDTAKVTVLLKDAPADVTRAVVTITQIALQGDSGTQVLSTRTVTTDLLTLANDVETLVDAAEIPAGTYSQLRFQISGGFLEVGGVIYASSPDYEGLPAGATAGGTLQMPSYDRSGLKVLLPGGGLEIPAGTTELLVDFDVSQSFGHVTGTDRWVMHPVIKATTVPQTGTLVVTLATAEGVTLPAGATLAGFFAVLTPAAGGDPRTVPLAELAPGTFGVRYVFLEPGPYTVSFAGPAGLTFETSPAIPAPATVAAGQTARADFLLTFVSDGAEL